MARPKRSTPNGPGARRPGTGASRATPARASKASSSGRSTAAGSASARSRRASVRRRRIAVGVSMVIVAAALLAVPMRKYIDQKARISAESAYVVDLEARNADLERQRELLEDPDEVRRIARRDYGLVEVGEESYTILPPATAGLVLPSVWPFDRLAGPIERAATDGP